MAHYDEIRRKSVVNSCLSPRKANKINGLLVQGLHCRETSAAFLHKLSFTYKPLLFVIMRKVEYLQKLSNIFKTCYLFGILNGIQ